MKTSLLATAASFAHLLGRPVSAARRAEDDDKQREGESDEDFKKRRESAQAKDDDLVQGDEETDEDFDARKKAADEDKKRDDETDDEHDARVKANKARRAKRAKAEEEGQDDEEGDDESDDADMRKAAARGNRLRERARCAAIFADKAAGKNPALAATLAFCTDLPRSQAIAVLRAGGVAAPAARRTLDQRMATIQTPPVSASDPTHASGGQNKAQQDATAIVVAGMRRRGQSDKAISEFVASRSRG